MFNLRTIHSEDKKKFKRKSNLYFCFKKINSYAFSSIYSKGFPSSNYYENENLMKVFEIQ
jgi:hypothetical protein